MNSIKERAGSDQQADELELEIAIDLRGELARLLALLDASDENIAATYVQMAIDVLVNGRSLKDGSS